MLKVHGISRNAELWLRPTPRELLRRYLLSMDGKEVSATFKKEVCSKSWSQVKMHFGLAVESIRHELEQQGWNIAGVAPTKDMVHQILTKCCSGVGTFGEMVRLSEQDKDEFSRFFKNIQGWAWENLRLFLPDPDKDWRDKE